MTITKDYQFDLGGVTFGHDTAYPVGNVEGLGSAGALRDRVQQRPGQDGVWFGREYRDIFELTFVDGGVKVPGDPGGAFDALATLTKAFQADDVRRVARAVTPLTIRRPGAAARLLYGRPGRFDPDLSLSVVGWIPWQGTFRCEDLTYYADAERVVDIGLMPGDTGGLHPTVSGGLQVVSGGLVSTGPSSLQSSVVNGGNVATWPVLTITGPVAGASVELVDQQGGVVWSLGLKSNLLAGDELTIDTRPWARTVLRADGASFAGDLTRDSWPSQSSIPPGTWAVVFRGVDGTGTANLRITTRDAFSTI